MDVIEQLRGVERCPYSDYGEEKSLYIDWWKQRISLEGVSMPLTYLRTLEHINSLSMCKDTMQQSKEKVDCLYLLMAIGFSRKVAFNLVTNYAYRGRSMEGTDLAQFLNDKEGILEFDKNFMPNQAYNTDDSDVITKILKFLSQKYKTK